MFAEKKMSSQKEDEYPIRRCTSGIGRLDSPTGMVLLKESVILSQEHVMLKRMASPTGRCVSLPGSSVP